MFLKSDVPCPRWSNLKSKQMWRIFWPIKANPRETSHKSLEEEKKLDEPTDENDEVKSVASTTLPDREEIPSSTFSSVFCSFSDGIKASFSTNGPCGRPKNWDTESIIEERKFGHKLATSSPTPSRDTASSSAKGTGKKSKGKKVSDLSVENDQSLNSQNPSQMEEKDFENDLQQGSFNFSAQIFYH